MTINKKIQLASAITVFTAFCNTPVLAQNDLEACTQISDSSARLECYDRILNPTNTADLPILAQPEIEGTPTEQRVLPAPIEAAHAPAPAPALVSGDDFGLELKQLPSPEADLRTFTVASARHNDFTGWTIEFENGQIWKQVGTNRYRIKTGQPYTIKRASFNSFLLGNANNNRNIRISRIE